MSVLFSQEWEYSADIAEMKNRDGQEIKQFDGNVVQPLKHEHAVLVGSKRLQDGLKLLQRAGRILPEMGRESPIGRKYDDQALPSGFVLGRLETWEPGYKRQGCAR